MVSSTIISGGPVEKILECLSSSHMKDSCHRPPKQMYQEDPSDNSCHLGWVESRSRLWLNSCHRPPKWIYQVNKGDNSYHAQGHIWRCIHHTEPLKSILNHTLPALVAICEWQQVLVLQRNLFRFLLCTVFTLIHKNCFLIHNLQNGGSLYNRAHSEHIMWTEQMALLRNIHTWIQRSHSCHKDHTHCCSVLLISLLIGWQLTVSQIS